MVTDKDKYRAQFFQICAFALMTPLGKIFLDLREMSFEDFNMWLLGYFMLALFFFICGIILATIGIIYVEEEGRK